MLWCMNPNKAGICVHNTAASYLLKNNVFHFHLNPFIPVIATWKTL